MCCAKPVTLVAPRKMRHQPLCFEQRSSSVLLVPPQRTALVVASQSGSRMNRVKSFKPATRVDEENGTPWRTNHTFMCPVFRVACVCLLTVGGGVSQHNNVVSQRHD
jgi:hypothetical protein